MGATSMSAAAGAAAGGSPPSPVIQADSRDDSALIYAGTGSNPSAGGTFLTITLGTNYSSSVDEGALPKIQVAFMLGGLTATQATAVLAAGLVYTVTTRTIVISCSSTVNALPASLSANSSGIGVVVRMDA